ncbi:addiction module antidote protein, HigA family [Izhakiella australiensis]|uniref:Addiction module antidote protein, HigA family n=1 Tax=Izhakiella australiensis TaxID=1926881 RepID=A0A1S8YQP7_9GAMM|nr:HigA family addiction module antitoxin [Izhakiella australiensis]OON41481.1 addiction module antidote protein, HigA family [Izhakiella australiensis]
MKMFNPPHPGAAIADAMEELRVGIREMARALDVAPSTLQRLVSEQTSVSPEMAVRLSNVIGSSPEVWMRLQDAYSLHKAEQSVDISRLTQLYKPSEHDATAC